MLDQKAVAVVGVGAILPDAPDALSFWKNIQAGRYSISEVPLQRWNPANYYSADPTAPDKTYSKIGGWVHNFKFDPFKWGIPIPPKVLAVMDDGQKWAIAAAYQALQDYGYPQRALNPVRTAVILGNAMAGENHYRTTMRIRLPEYLDILEQIPDFQNLPPQVREGIINGMYHGARQIAPDITEDTMPGELSNVIAGRVANVFNFSGANFVTDAACASSFAALQAAVDGLVSHKFDAVITGGIDHNMGVEGFVKFCKIGALSPDGSRPYADGANGFVMGEGAAVFLLKRLIDAEKDGDRIYGVVRGIGSSSDGKGKGITAPNPIGQQRAIERAWLDAGLSPDTVDLIEGHGTSTRVGDVAEVNSLEAAFRGLDIPVGRIALGSVKSNIGHLKAAAGAAGMLKTLFALSEKTLPPSVNFERPNPNIEFSRLPFYVNTQSRPWQQPKNAPRRAGMSSFGFGGTNFHVVLEEYLPGMLTSEKTIFPSATITGAAAALPIESQPVEQPVLAEAAPPTQPVMSISTGEINQKILELVSQQTGYPPEMLDMDLDLEADLGIDTVKQAELFASVREMYAIPRREDLRLSDYNTLAKVVQFVVDALPPADPTTPATAAAAASAKPGEPPVETLTVETDHPLPPRGLLFLSAETPQELKQQLSEAIAAARKGQTPPPAVPTAAELSRHERMAIDFTTAEELIKKGEKALRGIDTNTTATWQALTGQGVYHGSGAPGKIAFMFPGQGSQYANMLRELRDLSPIVAETFREADEVMTPILGRPLTELIFVKDEPETIAQAELALKDTTITQPAVLAADIAMLRLLASYGFKPDIVIGHSLGEYGALVTAGVLSFADALKIVSARGREMAKVSWDDNGAMAAVSAPTQDVERVLAGVDGYVVIANINSPQQSVIGGASAAVDAAVDAFTAAGFQAVKIPVSHAFHTRIVAPASGPLRAVVERLGVRAPQIPVIANVTGDLYPTEPAAVLDMLAEQLASPVQFVRSMQTLYASGARILVECGPKRVLSALATDNLKEHGDLTVLSTNHPRKGALPSLNEALCGLYAAGAVPQYEQTAASAVELKTETPQPETAAPVLVETIQFAQPLQISDGRLPLTGSVVISGAGLGLPGRGHPVFDDGNIERLLTGQNMIEPLPITARGTMLQKRVTRLNKSAAGATMEIIEDMDRTIKLAGQRGAFDPNSDFGIPDERVDATDIATQLAMAAGMEALRDAGIPLVMRYRQTSVGSYLPDRWMLPDALADETGVIFGSAFPGLERMSEEADRFYQHQNLVKQVETLRQLAGIDRSSSSALATEIRARLAELESQIASLNYHFDRRFIFRILNMGHSQFAEYIGARGPNTGVNAACATTTHAISLAEDWIRSGRARRVIVIAGDDVTSGSLVEWVGTGLLASGATTTEGNLRLAALPFDRRRNGMIMGMGAAALVLESEDAVRERGMRGIAEVLATQIGNSAFHGTRLDVAHVREVMDRLVRQAEQRFGLQRDAMAPHTVFISHETYTPARGGSAAAEIHALRHTFGDHANQVIIANTKGYTGHTMGVGIEDVLAVKALETRQIPPIAHLDDDFEPDPDLGDLNLSRGGSYAVDYALRLGAGFGSQIAMTLVRRIPGVAERINQAVYNRWLADVAGYARAEIEVSQRTLRIRHDGAPVRAPATSNWEAGQGPTLWADAPLSTPQPQPILTQIETSAPAAAPLETPEQPAIVLSVSDEDIKTRLLELVSAQTGYPAEMLDLELDLEADLGIDTVKQAELFAAVRSSYDIPRREDLRLSDYNTLAKVIGFVRESLGTAQSEAAPRGEAAVTTQVEPPAAAPTVTDAEIQTRLLALVSEKTGYPSEMLDMDLDLEADLGVDTVKQAELFASVREMYAIPRREDLRLSDYNTLAKVVGFVRESLDVKPEPAQTAAETVSQPVETAKPAQRDHNIPTSDVPRRVPVPVLRPRLELCKPTAVTLEEETRVIVVHDLGKTGESLARKLRSRKVEVLHLRDLSADAIQAQIAEWNAAGKIHGVYFLPALDIEPEWSKLSPEQWQAENARRVTALYHLMRALPGDPFLVSATRLGGLHACLPGDIAAPLGGAVTGFTKAYAWEHPRTLVKCVDFARGVSATSAATWLLDETLQDPGAVEIGREGEQRYTISLIEQPLAAEDTPLNLTDSSVYLVTGAAGGIGTPILHDLARHLGGVYHLTGRSPLPEATDPHLKLLSGERSVLQQHIARELAAQGQKATPAKIEQQINALERSAAALKLVEDLRALGCQAHYHAVDVTDAVAMQKLYAQIGQVDVILHAAGLDYSHLLDAKPPEEFARVFNTKANGFYHLVRGIHNLPQPPQAVISFTSIAGRFGNAGQTDYAAANDLLCKLTAALRQSHPHIHFLALDWGAWAEVGMASRGSTPTMMERAGIEMLKPEQAVPLVRRELLAAKQGEVVLAGALGLLARPRDRDGGLDLEKANAALTSGKPTHIMLSHLTGLDLMRGITLEVDLDPAEEPFLKDHALNGIPILPGVMGIEGFSAAATHIATTLGASANGFRVARLEDIRFLAPFKFYRNQPRRITWYAQVVRQHDGLVAHVTMESVMATSRLRANEIVRHFSGRVYLQPLPGKSGRADRVQPPHWNGGRTVDAEDVYRLYFHGPAFQVLDGVQISGDHVIGRMRSDMPPATSNRQAMLSAPLMIELCMQTAGVYEAGATGMLALPSAIGEVTLYSAESRGAPVYAEVSPKPEESGELSFDARVIDGDGQLYLEIKDYRTSPLPYPAEDALIEPMKKLLEE